MDKNRQPGGTREGMDDKAWIEDAWNSLMNFEPRELAPAKKPAPEPLAFEPSKPVEIEPAKVEMPEEINERRQRKLMRFLMKGNPDILKQQDAEISADEQEKVLDVIKSGEIKIEDWSDILGNVERPVDIKPADEIFGEVAKDDFAKEMLARVCGIGIENVDKTSGEEIKRLAKNCDTPIAFEFRASLALNGVKRFFEDKYLRYKDATDKLERAIYGEQKDYWDIARKLMKETKDSDSK